MTRGDVKQFIRFVCPPPLITHLSRGGMIYLKKLVDQKFAKNITKLMRKEGYGYGSGEDVSGSAMKKILEKCSSGKVKGSVAVGKSWEML